jgi:hypothetical protein
MLIFDRRTAILCALLLAFVFSAAATPGSTCTTCLNLNLPTGSTVQVTYTFSIVSGALPKGITLNTSTGQLSGKPTTAGTFTFTTKVVDANGNSDTDTCTIVVQQDTCK